MASRDQWNLIFLSNFEVFTWLHDLLGAIRFAARETKSCTQDGSQTMLHLTNWLHVEEEARKFDLGNLVM